MKALRPGPARSPLQAELTLTCRLTARRKTEHDVEPRGQFANPRICHGNEIHRNSVLRLRIADTAIASLTQELPARLKWRVLHQWRDGLCPVPFRPSRQLFQIV